MKITSFFNIKNQVSSLISVAKIRKFARKSYRYIDAYRVRGSDGNSLTPKQVEYAVKRYRQHRKIPLRILNDLE